MGGDVNMTDQDLAFSICIPNYNYENYIRSTIESVLRQKYCEYEILISDNASTDASVEVASSFQDPRIRVRVNRWNVGFAGNLDKAARMAVGQRMIMLSSDDLAAPNALSTYAGLVAALAPEKREKTVITGARTWIDASGKHLGVAGADMKLWRDAVEDPELSAAAGARVLRVDAGKLLKRALLLMRTPCPFVSTCYPRSLYEAVEGYGGGRMINPDKWFVWKLLTVADEVIFVDEPLFHYRWHGQNQAAQQQKSGALKHLVDEYANTLEATSEMLAKAGITREEMVAAFIEEDVALRGLEQVARGNRPFARRALSFGKAVYPREVGRNWKARGLQALLWLGPAGTMLARAARGKAVKSWARQHGGSGERLLRADAHRGAA